MTATANGSMGTRASGLDEKGVVHYIDTIGLDAGDIRDEVIPALDARIRAAEGQPLAGAVLEGLQQSRALAVALADSLDSTMATGKRLHADDYARADDPRGGTVDVEAKADARTTDNDRNG